MMETWYNQFDAYPRWLVFSSLAMVAVVGLWLAAKILKAVFTMLLAFAIILSLLAVVWWLFFSAGHL